MSRRARLLVGILAVAAALLVPGRGWACYSKTITIDGNTSDWGGQFTFLDQSSDTGISPAADIKSIVMSNDSQYLYLGVQTYLPFTGLASLDFFIDVANDDSGSFDADDRDVRVYFSNNGNCQSIQVRSATGGGSTNVGCYSNYGASASFIEVRIPLKTLGISSCPTIGVVASLESRNGAASDVSPSAPYPTFITYANTGSVAPTYARFREAQALASGSGVLLAWRTSGEWQSQGTRVLRESAGQWLEVGEVEPPSPLPSGARHAVLDPDGRAGDRYLLRETDLSGKETTFGPFEASASASLPAAAPLPAPRKASARGGRSSGHELKIEVEKEGLYVACRDDLIAAGWPPGQAPSVTRAGSPVEVFAVGSAFAGCDGAAFWARAPEAPEAPFEVYRLSQGGSWKNLPALALAGTGPVPVGARASAIRHTRILAQYPDQATADFNRYFVGWASASWPQSFSVALPGLVDGSSLGIDAAWKPASAGAVLEVVSGSARATAPDLAGGWQRSHVDLSAGSRESVDLSFRSSGKAWAVLGEVEIAYPASLSFEQGLVAAEAPQAGWYLANAAPSGAIAALDVSDGLAHRPLVARFDGKGKLVFRAEGPSRVRLVHSSAIARAALQGVAPRSEMRLLQSQWLALAPSSLVGTLAPLIKKHQGEGLSAAAVAIDDVYDWFSDSQPTRAALARMLDWAEQRQTMPRFLLLVGSSGLNPTRRLDWDRPTDMPAGPVFAESMWGWSDASLVADAAGQPRAAVGRVPTSDPAEISGWVQKALLAPPTSGSLVRLAGKALYSDDPDFTYLVSLVGEAATPPVQTAQLTPPALATLWAGAGVVAYIGHGDPTGWTPDWINQSQVGSLRSAAPPVVLSNACRDGMFVSANGGLGWALVSAGSQAGASLAIGTTSLNAPFVGAAFLRRLLETTASASTWGEAWLEAQRSDDQGGARTFVLFGDPATPAHTSARLVAP